MSNGPACPVCKHPVTQALVVGEKIVCEHCESVHRVREEGGRVILKVLIESLELPAAELEAEAEAGGPRPEAVGPRLVTWKDRARAGENERPARGGPAGRRPTVRRRR